MTKQNVLLCLLIGVALSSLSKEQATQRSIQYHTMDSLRIKITVGANTITGVLYDNPTSRDFASLLPLELMLEDHANTEKASDLSKKLTTENAPSGSDPYVGTIAYYAPWGNLALYYKDFAYSNCLVELGKLDGGTEVLEQRGSLQARIELIK